MPRPHREGILKTHPDTEIKLGQTWENRWTHRQTVVVSPPNEDDVILVRGYRLNYMQAHILRRDFTLVDG